MSKKCIYGWSSFRSAAGMAVLGGTSLFGGRGAMAGTILGALTVAVIGNGLILAHLSPFLTPIVTGTIILIAIWLNVRLFRGKRRGRCGGAGDGCRGDR